MPVELRIALRYLTARRKQAFISLISAISMLGVVVGVTALFIALGLMTGLQSEIREKILGSTAHVSVFRTGNETIEDYAKVAATLRQVPGVLGAAPVAYGKGILTAPAGGTAAVTLKGVVPRDEKTVTRVSTQMEEGAFDALEAVSVDGLPPILLGRDLAARLNVGLGDVVTVFTPQGHLSPMGVQPGRRKFQVAGTVRSGLYEFDSAWAYIPLGVAQRVFDLGDRASFVEARVVDMFRVRETAAAMVGRLGEGYSTTDWIEMNHSLFSALWLEKTAIAITIGLIVMVAALNIVATLILMVMEKHKDIAVLVSMGASRGAISRIFMLQGTLIGAAGTLVGAILGFGACQVLDRYRLIRVPEDVYQISYVPFRLLPGDAALVVVGAVLVCFLATLHPARGAARLDPAEALRYE
jgi:lipoprotein-releasing system permease protein